MKRLLLGQLLTENVFPFPFTHLFASMTSLYNLPDVSFLFYGIADLVKSISVHFKTGADSWRHWRTCNVKPPTHSDCVHEWDVLCLLVWWLPANEVKLAVQRASAQPESVNTLVAGSNSEASGSMPLQGIPLKPQCRGTAFEFTPTLFRMLGVRELKSGWDCARCIGRQRLRMEASPKCRKKERYEEIKNSQTHRNALNVKS
jgi:hypothetical protein